MMEIKSITAIIAVIALVTVAAGVAATMNQASLQSESNAASFQATTPPAGSIPANPFDPYGPAGQPLPNGQPRVILASPAAGTGFTIVQQGGVYYAQWVLTNTGRQPIEVQAYATINGVVYVSPRQEIQPNTTITVRSTQPIPASALPTTALVNVREFRGKSSNFWVSYDTNQRLAANIPTS